jgi:hypothetical protein
MKNLFERLERHGVTFEKDVIRTLKVNLYPSMLPLYTAAGVWFAMRNAGVVKGRFNFTQFIELFEDAEA